LRMKVLYDFTKVSADVSEKRRPGFNVLVGVWPTAGDLGSLGVASLFTRFYYGVNPHGQFRNESNFWLAGFGLRLDR
jgi:hypothetical protein